jgi:transcriptional regulator with XRE-family HTH domain
MYPFAILLGEILGYIGIMDIGHRLYSLRSKLKYETSQAQVAMIVGITPGHMGNLETGKKLPSLELLLKLADYYRVSVDYLLRGDENGEITIVPGQPEPTVFDLLPSEIHNGLEAFAQVLLNYQYRNQEEAVADYLTRMLDQMGEKRGSENSDEFLSALNLFTRTGDDSMLRRWLSL